MRVVDVMEQNKQKKNADAYFFSYSFSFIFCEFLYLFLEFCIFPNKAEMQIVQWLWRVNGRRLRKNSMVFRESIPETCQRSTGKFVSIFRSVLAYFPRSHCRKVVSQ